MTKVQIQSDYADIFVNAKDGEDEEFLIRHALHQLLKRYKKKNGETALDSVLNELEAYHRSEDR